MKKRKAFWTDQAGDRHEAEILRHYPQDYKLLVKEGDKTFTVHYRRPAGWKPQPDFVPDDITFSRKETGNGD